MLFDRPFTIISTERPGLSAAELAAREEQLITLAKANGYKVIPTMGYYKGDEECSFILHGQPTKRGHPLADLTAMLAAAYNQDSFIIYDGTYGFVRDKKGEQWMLGVPVPATEGDRTVLPSGEAFTFA